jgi:glucose-1-phosphate adenylyltransferase
MIKGGEHLPDFDSPNYTIRDGIVIVKKGAVIEEGTRIM